MGWKRLTFILIPHSQSTIKQMSFHRTIIYGALLFLGAGIIMMIFYIMGFKGKSFYAARAEKIAAENRVLEQQLALFDTSLSRIHSRVAELDSLNRIILKESNISTRDLRAEDDPGQAGGEYGYRLPIERKLYLIDRLETESRAFEKNFNSLYRVAEDNAELLKRIPSIRPAEGPLLGEFGPAIDESTGRQKLNEGVNINNVEGTPVVATADGVVSKLVQNATDENGIYIIIDHGNGYETIYTHLRPQVLVREGRKVTRGEQIGSIGRTGIMIVQVAPHILYKVRRNGVYVDPAKYFFAPQFSPKSEDHTALSPRPAPRS
ncbi:MAG: peptidoglycan DD-metalloendopeptidase family protein [Candidatus Latescibacterota bacterium]